MSYVMQVKPSVVRHIQQIAYNCFGYILTPQQIQNIFILSVGIEKYTVDWPEHTVLRQIAKAHLECWEEK